ncbi:MAG: hypothetical protein JNL25_17980 [Rhodospirillaceae bacterium]|nr:hypothetical protein [Rhodospirillaceae bacterium]
MIPDWAVPAALRLWPGLGNPVWKDRRAAALALGPALAVRVAPQRVRRKLDPRAAATIKEGFLIQGLDQMPKQDVRDLYTYFDMLDVARHGENMAATRLYRWLKASWEAGRPVTGRGQVFDSEERIADYYRTYLELYRSLQRDGYRYDGADEICFGIGADGEIFHIRRGTHRLAAAHILELPSVSGRITHIDRRFATQAVAAAGARPGGTTAILADAIQAAIDRPVADEANRQ